MGFQPVEEVISHIGGKVLVFGEAGTGKSHFLGTFPNINLVDTEDGQNFYLLKNKNVKNVMRTVSASKVQETLDELNDEELLDDFDTIAIDSATKLYENMQSAAYEVAENRAIRQKRKGMDVDLDDINISKRDWGHIKRWNQQLATSYILFSELGKWVVVTAHQKDIFKELNKKEQKEQGVEKIKIGEAPDLAKKANYDYDIVLKTFYEEKNGETKYYAKVLKDRTEITKQGDIIENPSFEIWKPVWELTKKYGTKKAIDLNLDVQEDVRAMESEDEKADDIIDEWKLTMKSAKEKASENQNIMKKINKFMSDNEISIKNLTASPVETLQELLDYTKLVINE